MGRWHLRQSPQTKADTKRAVLFASCSPLQIFWVMLQCSSMIPEWVPR